ncbi:dermonecrotic toxin domain-containing protein [Pseudomonas gingeri]
MTTDSFPYEFAEALELRDTPNDRERALNISSTDRDWLRNVFLPNQQARQALDDPMTVEKFTVEATGIVPVDLAGVFLMNPGTDDCSYLYSPGLGLEHFDTRSEATQSLLSRLNSETQRDELLRFVALETRSRIRFDGNVRVKAEPIEGAVFLDRRRSVDQQQRQNLQTLNEQLLKLPTLAALLNKMLNDELGRRFAGVNLASVNVTCYRSDTPDQGNASQRRPVGVHSLADALLAHYLAQAWPADQTREFSAPGYNAVPADTAQWERAITDIAGSLKLRLHSELESYWNTVLDSGHSRRQLFSDVMGTCWRTELLKQLQWENISPRTHHWLAALYPYTPARLRHTRIRSLGYNTSKPSQAALANAFVVSDESVNPGALFVYAYGRLTQLNDQDALDSSLLRELHDTGGTDELTETLSLSELDDLRQFPALATQQAAVDQPVFENRLDAIIAKQRDNIDYVLARYHRSNGQLALGAALDAALDIRTMISRKLQSLDTRERWSTRLDRSSDKPEPPPAKPSDAQATAQDTAQAHGHTLEILKKRLGGELAKRPDLLTFAQNALHEALIDTRRGNLVPATLYINQYPSASAEQQGLALSTSISLAEHLLERSVGLAPPLADRVDTGLFSRDPDGRWSRIDNLDIPTANPLVDAALQDFLPRLLRRQRTFYSQNTPLLREALTSALRYEARQRVLAGILDDSARELLEVLLDSPDSPRRKGLRGFIPDAFELTLKTAGPSLPRKLFNCFLITERGGLDPVNSGRALLWTPAGGLEAFASLPRAEVELNRRLHTPVQSLSLLENLVAAPPPAPLWANNQHNGMSIGFARIRNDFLTDLTDTVADKALGDLAEAASSPLPAAILQGHFQSCLLRHASLAYLEKALDATRHTRLHSALPAWLASAPASQQLALAELLDRHRQQVDAPLDYHHDIPDIRHFARTKLASLLSRDYPAARLDPDDLYLSLPDLDAPGSHTLTDYALRHFDEIDGATATLTSASPLPAGLTVAHLNALVREAGIGTHYAALLDSHLSHGEKGVPERRELFSLHLVWQGLEHALRQYLQHSLSAEAHGFIRHLLGMPDGVARLPLAGNDIVVYPLALLRQAWTSADRALGLYLIGRSDNRGPLVLFSPYGEQPAFREYGNETQLMSELGRPGPLRQLVLGRLASGVRQFYGEQVFSRQTVSAVWNAFKGNFLHRLYHDMTALLKDQLGLQDSRGHQSAWSTVVHLLGNQLHQDTRFMLGRLRMPWLIWQTLPRFKEAADKAWQGHWTVALEEFTRALAQLALAREAPTASALVELPKPAQEPVPAAAPVESPFPRWPRWGDIPLTREQQDRVLGYEARDIALNDLEHDTVPGIHTDPGTRRQYAAVGGRVFQVRSEDRRWRIVSDQEPGPWLRKDQQGQWELDLKGRLLGGGDGGRLVDRINTRQTVGREIKVLATGMKAIRLLYPDKARQIRQAHALAVTYLRNARQRLQSLAASTRLDSQRQLYLQEFFGLKSISRGLNQRIGRMLDKLLMELLSPARSPDLSELYVLGAARTPERMCAAFVVTCDHTRKIYLNELFFEPALEVYEPIRPRTFNSVLHNMATILLHEFSHIVFNTVDIAYLDAFRPFYDLLDTNTRDERERQEGLKELQETALSSRTPSQQLFRVEDEITGTWHDIEDEPYKRVLALTRSPDLHHARRKFQEDDARRIDVILANADSVALFISYLGRPTEFYPIFSGTPRQEQGSTQASSI